MLPTRRSLLGLPRVAPLPLLLLACGPSGEGTDTPEGSAAPATDPPGEVTPPPTPASTPAPTPSAWVYDPEPPPPPDLDAAALATAISSSLDIAMSLDLSPVMTSYLELWDSRDGTCPFRLEEKYPGYEAHYWADQCSTGGGTSFSGEGYYLLQSYTDGGIRWDVDGLYLAGRVQSPSDGVEAASVGYRGVGSDTSGYYYYQEIDGPFTVTPETSVLWLSGALRPSLLLVGYRLPRTAVRYLFLDGGLNGVEGELGTVLFSALEMNSASSCPNEPGGSISVRSAGGEWYDVLFDGPTSANPEPDPSLCDTCGAVWYRGAYIFDACVDFAPLVSWEETPW